MSTIMSTSKNGYNLLGLSEGCVLYAYDDSTGKKITSREECKGFPTIGWGHLIRRDEEYLFNGIDQAKADELRSKDIAWVELAVNSLIKQPLNQNQFDALVDLCYNIGIHGFRDSPVTKDINISGTAIEEDFLHHIYSKGKIIEGLKIRRKRDYALFIK